MFTMCRALPRLPSCSPLALSVLFASVGTIDAPTVQAQQEGRCTEISSAEIAVDQGHRWKPPFGLDRVGAPPVVHVTLSSERPPAETYYVYAYRDGKQSARVALTLLQNPPSPAPKKPGAASLYFAHAPLKSRPDEVALVVDCASKESLRELAREKVTWSELEADARARPDKRINPVDLGTFLVPHDSLLLSASQTAVIEAAAIAHVRSLPNAQLRAWFEGGKAVQLAMPLAAGKRAMKTIQLPLATTNDRTVLHVSLTDGARELWKKEIQTMVVAQPPSWPSFGAVETKLRYDAPIPVRHPVTEAALPSIEYAQGWPENKNDVVVFLPNGSRFVFWRGSNYVPVWASPYNTAISYQWAENLDISVDHPDGTIDRPEPLFDGELRYGYVRIVESTPARVHVRWTYQLTDNLYRVWGDQAAEDYYFYPDGFGTRNLTVISRPDTPYQLTEFIVLTPAAAHPFDILPRHMADVLFITGEKRNITYPYPFVAGENRRAARLVANPQALPLIYRLFAHASDPAAAIYFSPRDPSVPRPFEPFYERGEMVTPTYWGSHWPVGRGKWTHWVIDEDLHTNPTHNSVAGWANMPEPLAISRSQVLDTLGRSQPMTERRWVALIAKTDASDATLLEWALSFSDPPSLQLTGARLDFPAYSSERRALKLVVESSSIDISLKPTKHTLNPVFELQGAPQKGLDVLLDGQPLPEGSYAWDGSTLWMKANIDVDGSSIALRFR